MGEPHLRVFSRKDDTLSSRVESSQCRIVDILGSSLFLTMVRRNVDIDAGVDLALALDGFQRAPRLAQNIVRGQAARWNACQRHFAVVEQFVVKTENLFFRDIVKDCFLHMFNMSSITRTGAIVVENRLDEIRIVRITFKILFCAEERTERVCMPYMEAHVQFRPDRLRRFVDALVCRILAVVPELLPCKDLRIIHQNPPELNEIAIGWALACPGLGDELAEPFVPFDGTLYVDSAILRCLAMILTETSSGARPGVRANQIVERSLLLRTPHHSIDIV